MKTFSFFFHEDSISSYVKILVAVGFFSALSLFLWSFLVLVFSILIFSVSGIHGIVTILVINVFPLNRKATLLTWAVINRAFLRCSQHKIKLCQERALEGRCRRKSFFSGLSGAAVFVFLLLLLHDWWVARVKISRPRVSRVPTVRSPLASWSSDGHCMPSSLGGSASPPRGVSCLPTAVFAWASQWPNLPCSGLHHTLPIQLGSGGCLSSFVLPLSGAGVRFFFTSLLFLLLEVNNSVKLSLLKLGLGFCLLTGSWWMR